MRAASITHWLLAVILAAGPIVAGTASAEGPVKHPSPAESEQEQAEFIDLPAAWDLTIYTIVVFLILLAVLYKFAWPNIREGLDKRAGAITQARDDAVKAREEAEAIRADLAAQMADAQGKIRAMLDEARRDADVLRQTEKEAGVKDAQIERDRATREIESAKDAALQEIYLQAVDLASLMSSKAIGREISPADHTRLVDESLAELAQSAKPIA